MVSPPARPRRLVTLLTALTVLIASGSLTAGSAGAGPATAAPATAAPATAAPAAGTPAPVQCQVDPATPKRQFRAMWIASVANLDWPSRPGLSVPAQQAEFRGLLDVAESRNLNAVVVQIRPSADALWPSPHEPWSQVLTGSQGGDPGYDPLAFMIAETHARGLEFHGWFNPYRVATHSDLGRLRPDHPARQHPDWVFGYGGQLYYNPGLPQVRDHVTESVMHAVEHYDLDAVHWDDYFYPYPSGGEPIPDADTFAAHGGGFGSIGDWRRANIDTQVEVMSQRIHAAKPWVRFGVSPFGIWRNQSTDPRGSATAGLQSYDAVFADTRRWISEGWLDYVVPQIYWHIGFSVADYAELVPWWSQQVAGTDVHLYIGQATYRAGAPGQPAAWQDPAELSGHLHLNRGHPQVRGDVQFRAQHVAGDPIGAVSAMAADHYSRPALVPVAGHLGGAPPAAPRLDSAARTGGGVRLDWQPGAGDASVYAVYRVDGAGPADPCALADGGNLLATVRGGSYTDPTAAAGATYTYHVTALHRLGHESQPSAGVVVTGDGEQFQAEVDATSGRWRPLGSFHLAAGDRPVVGVSRWAGGTGLVIADAVRITRL